MSQLIKTLLASLLLSYNVIAQPSPAISYKDYGFDQPVTKVEAVYYNLDKVPLENSTHNFNKNGFIESFHIQNIQNNSWEKAKSSYKNNRLYKRVFKYSDPIKNRKQYYSYNTDGQLTEGTIKLKNGKTNHITYSYQNQRLNNVSSDLDSSKTTFYYSNSGILYKAVKIQKIKNQLEVITNYFYLENKEITSYVLPKNHFKVSIYLDNMRLKFDLNESEYATKRLLKGIQRFDKEAPKDNLPFGLKEYSNQTLQFYDKNKVQLKLTEVLFFSYKTTNTGNKIAYAEAKVNVKTQNITGVRFYKTTLKDGSVLGSTTFDEPTVLEFKNQLQYLLNPEDLFSND